MTKKPAPIDEKPSPEASDATPATPPSAQVPAPAPSPTGLGRSSLYQRHPRTTGIAAVAVAVVLLSALTSWGVGTATVAATRSSSSSELPVGVPTTSPVNGDARASAPQQAFRATIRSMAGQTWTVLTKKGNTVSVMLDGSTQFGTKRSAESVDSFAIGDGIIVVVTRGMDGMPVATRVVKAPTGTP